MTSSRYLGPASRHAGPFGEVGPCFRRATSVRAAVFLDLKMNSDPTPGLHGSLFLRTFSPARFGPSYGPSASVTFVTFNLPQGQKPRSENGGKGGVFFGADSLKLKTLPIVATLSLPAGAGLGLFLDRTEEVSRGR